MKLFEGAYLHGAINYGRTYDVTGDGQRFLMIKEPQATGASTVPPASSSFRTGMKS
jgi:hypothetical protein